MGTGGLCRRAMLLCTDRRPSDAYTITCFFAMTHPYQLQLFIFNFLCTQITSRIWLQPANVGTDGFCSSNCCVGVTYCWHRYPGRSDEGICQAHYATTSCTMLFPDLLYHVRLLVLLHGLRGPEEPSDLK
uniref:Uncharacterized protein n=1 Tax=Trypanosoma vivax (strain Y486) TaxID=1055687 RepID=G0U7F5_TRYVY|nr:hypothetical protein TVY486_1008590 [Trypanosoma vivax Y486]